VEEERLLGALNHEISGMWETQQRTAHKETSKAFSCRTSGFSFRWTLLYMCLAIFCCYIVTVKIILH